ncbi:sensor domain-containing diguanylate cyclase [Marinobacter pelagius]|uniref:Diguanylate cyclase (GGDEF) domain-containing protein n=1 Tax=Marinobacter pelagius TaxID=379482 RepID=A0A1I4RZ08_9GAMM|nr:diguanylate cyclase (GGDEF) domain-containing protein [Marinobacter pelagius]
MLIQRWFGSLVNRAVALVTIVILVTALIVAGAGSLLSRAELEQQARNQVATIAELVAVELDDKLGRRLEILTEVAASLTMSETALRGRARVLVQQQVALHHQFDGVYLIDPTGEVLAEYPEAYGQTGLNVSSREYFSQITSQLSPVISEPYTSNYKDKPAVMIAAPIFNHKGRFIGMLGGAILLESDNFLEEFAGLTLGKTGYIEVVSRRGMIISHGGTGEMMIPVGREYSSLSEALEGFEGTVLNQSSVGKTSIMSFQQMAQVPWFVVAVWPAREAYAPLTRVADTFIWILLAVIVILVPLALWRFRRLMAPLQTLSEQIQERYRGTRRNPVDVAGGREIRRVAEVFNTVTETLHQEQQRAESILGVLQEGVLMLDTDGMIRFANGAACRFIGVDEDCLGENFFDRVTIEVDGKPWHRTDFLQGEDIDSLYATLRNRRELEFDIDLTLLHIRQGLHNEQMVFVLRDDTERRREEQRLSWEATHDSLTQLLNRRAFTATLVKLLGEAARQDTPSVLMLIDLDHFKPVNDQGGHLLGDDLLRRLADLLKDSVRHSDTVARLGGDEFGVILPSCGLGPAELLAEKIRAGVEALRIAHEGRSFGVTASIGLTELTATNSGPREVLARADEGCYVAKSRGRNAVVVVPVPPAS